MTPNTIALALKTLPPLFWAAVIAASITAAVAFLGVLISNLSNAKRLRIQLEHDSLEKSRERISQMRRSVYMHAAAELSTAIAHLGNIPQCDPRTDNLTAPLLSFNSVAAQIQLIAESETAILCAELGKRLTAVFFEMISKAQPIFELKIEAEMHESMRAHSQREFDQLIAKAKAENESPKPDHQLLSRFSEGIEFYRVQIETHGKAMIGCLDRKLALQKQYARELLPETKPIVDAQIPLMVQVRKELELTSNVAEITARAEAGLADFSALIKKVLGKLH